MFSLIALRHLSHSPFYPWVLCLGVNPEMKQSERSCVRTSLILPVRCARLYFWLQERSGCLYFFLHAAPLQELCQAAAHPPLHLLGFLLLTRLLVAFILPFYCLAHFYLNPVVSKEVFIKQCLSAIPISLLLIIH